jgi:ribosome biogenesis GTPase A
VGDEPAVTKSQQVHQISVRHSIIDTPGLMWPKIEHESDGWMLAASHAIGRNAIIDEEVAVFLAGLLLQRYPAQLAARYGLEINALDELDGVAVVEGVARRRGLLMRGGEADFEKASMVLLQDYRDGKLGRISLETPETRSVMLGQKNVVRAADTAPD